MKRKRKNKQNKPLDGEKGMLPGFDSRSVSHVGSVPGGGGGTPRRIG